MAGTSDPLSSNYSPSITHWCTVSTALLISEISIKSSLFPLDLSLEAFFLRLFIYFHILFYSDFTGLHPSPLLLSSPSPPLSSCYLLPSSPRCLPRLSFLTFLSLCLSGPLAYFNHLVLFFPPPSSRRRASPRALSSRPPIPLLFLLPRSPLPTLHRPPFSFPSFSLPSSRLSF